MRDVVQKIIETECEAKLVVDTARIEAEGIVSEAREKARGFVERARQEALVEAEKIVKDAVEAAESEKQTLLADASEKIGSEIQLDAGVRKLAVERVVRCVCKQP